MDTLVLLGYAVAGAALASLLACVPALHIYNVAGPLCESGDFLGKERRLPKVEQGDLIAVFDVGAYGLAMSSQHTAQPRPAMVLVNQGNAEIVRQRENFDDLTRLDRIPGWLK